MKEGWQTVYWFPAGPGIAFRTYLLILRISNWRDCDSWYHPDIPRNRASRNYFIATRMAEAEELPYLAAACEELDELECAVVAEEAAKV
ncbi:hypothetical protein PoB_004838600 [Plakobranchus ocellatus]|uniref:Uncharacterized protein n=1 Tax=Plakobranchus ocellatus TaxID=259542 RepID=A0AAV4BEY0_9GAST|nr:hypothetical protein PoB_004838600 [Plakobranchus ocellatus]